MVSLDQLDEALRAADVVARMERDLEQACRATEQISRLVVPSIAQQAAAEPMAQIACSIAEAQQAPLLQAARSLTEVGIKQSKIATTVAEANTLLRAADYIVKPSEMNIVGTLSSLAEPFLIDTDWRPNLMRWASPSISDLFATHHTDISRAVSDAARPIIQLATTQALCDVFESPLHGLSVQIENLMQVPNFKLPSIEVPLPDVPIWPDRSPDDLPLLKPSFPTQPDLESAPPTQPGWEIAPPQPQLTKKDLEEAIEKALERCKTPLRVRIRDGIIVAIIIRIAVDYVQVDDHVIRIIVEGIQIVIDGASYFLPYLP
jgi:hypothetical protein